MLLRAHPLQLWSKLNPRCPPFLRTITRSPTHRSAGSKTTIPVTSYTEESHRLGGKKDGHRTTLHIVDQKPKSPPTVENVSRKAVPFDRSVLDKLTPTMRSFTLDGKVAVVTGYGLSQISLFSLYICSSHIDVCLYSDISRRQHPVIIESLSGSKSTFAHMPASSLSQYQS